MNLPTLNIDFCFVEALCECTNPAKDTLTKVIDEMFEISKIAMVKDDQDENESPQEGKDIMEELWRSTCHFRWDSDG